MLVDNYGAYFTAAAHGVLFVLFAIKFVGLVKNSLVPLLHDLKNERDQSWLALQEKHWVLVSQKKQLATQFLQQEKQIALLTAKLETWHLVCKHKQQEKEHQIADRAQIMNERAALQQYNCAQRRLIVQSGEQVINEVMSTVSDQADALFVQYMKRAAETLVTMQKKDTVYESPDAKKAKSA
jgi:hypothetical protein